MKKLILLIVVIAFAYSAKGNVAVPRACISEILVDSSGNWTLELGFLQYDIEYIDSIQMATSSGSSSITSYTLISGGGIIYDSLAVITNANLETPLTMSQQGDFVTITTYYTEDWQGESYDHVSYGNYPGSYIDCIHNGESVISYDYMDFCIDHSPSIGAGNNTDGYLGTFRGIVYDPDGNPITQGYVFSFITDGLLILNPASDGLFTENIGSRRYTFDIITVRLLSPPYIEYSYNVVPVDFCLRPDSLIYRNIITTGFVTVKEVKENNNATAVTIAPNPFSDRVVFYFNLKNTGSDDIMNLSIQSLDGKVVHQITLSTNQKKYEWIPSGSIPTGPYIYRLENGKEIMKTGKFVRL